MIGGLDACVAANGPEVVVLCHANFRASVNRLETLLDLLISNFHLLELVNGCL
jgi:hypothetical protein